MSSGAGAWNSRFWWDSVLCFNPLVGVCAIEDMMEIKKMVFALRLPCLLWLFGLGAALKGWVILTSSRNPFKHTPPTISQNIKKKIYFAASGFWRKAKWAKLPRRCVRDWLCPVRARHPIYHLLPQQKVGVLWLFKAIYYILNALNYRIAINLFSRYCGSIVGSLPSSSPRGTNSSKVKRKGAEKAIKRTITPKNTAKHLPDCLFVIFFQSRWRHSPRGFIPSQMTRRWTSGCRWPTWMSTGS